MPGATGVMRRALLIWGWGHVAVGDRRGWLLMLLQPLAIGGLLLAAWQLIDGTLWLAVFVPLVALLVLWVGQAVHAHHRATALGGAPGGELQLALFLPFAFALLTAFWLTGGRHGSPAATLEAYMEAWEDGQPGAALVLFAAPRQLHEVTGQWQSDSGNIERQLATGLATYGEASGLDPTRPFGNLRVTQIDAPSGYARFVIELVRSERFETTLLGFIPTAGQRTALVGRIVVITLREVEPLSRGIPVDLSSTSWRISSFEPVWTGD